MEFNLLCNPIQDYAISKSLRSVNVKPLMNSPDKFCEQTLRVGEGVNFDVPKNVTDNSKVVIKFDKNYKSIKYKDIPLYH